MSELDVTSCFWFDPPKLNPVVGAWPPGWPPKILLVLGWLLPEKENVDDGLATEDPNIFCVVATVFAASVEFCN